MKTINLVVLLSLLSLPGFSGAEIYKVIDENGTVVYTDSPSKDNPGEVVKLRPITPLAKPEQYQSPDSASAPQRGTTAFTYQSLEISSPPHDSTVRNQGNFKVRVSLTPSLNRAHRLRLLVDGEPQGEPQRSTVFTIENMFRGSHQLQVEIIDSKEKVIKQAASTIHVQRPIVRPDVIVEPLPGAEGAQ